jgi:UDP-N-acetylglucosamine transferase subunit ALG13
MIFVTVGTNEAPFNRLVEAVDALGREDVVIQYGAANVRPTFGRGVDFMPFEDVVEHLRAADATVMHAGAGSVLVALANGQTPIIVPRQRRFGEAVDDHQVAFARRLHVQSLAVLVDDPADLAAALDAHTARPRERPLEAGRLVAEIENYLDRVIEDRRLIRETGLSKPRFRNYSPSGERR